MCEQEAAYPSPIGRDAQAQTRGFEDVHCPLGGHWTEGSRSPGDLSTPKFRIADFITDALACASGLYHLLADRCHATSRPSIFDWGVANERNTREARIRWMFTLCAAQQEPGESYPPIE